MEEGPPPQGHSPTGGHPQHPQLTGTGRALEVEDGLQVVGLVKLQVKGVLSLWGPRTGMRWQPLDQPLPAACTKPSTATEPSTLLVLAYARFTRPTGAGHRLTVLLLEGYGRAPGRARGGGGEGRL